MQDKTWRGANIHKYAAETDAAIRKHTPDLYKQFGTTLRTQEFETILRELRNFYGPKVTYGNLRKVFRNGVIHDPEVPSVNCAVLLKAVWHELKLKNDASLFKHFDETLNQIGATCLAGISIRLSMDYIALTEDVGSEQ